MNDLAPASPYGQEKIGCARKVPAQLLAELFRLPGFDAAWDDAGICEWGGQTTLATVDLVHPPCEDPGIAGRIVVHHCVNDIVVKGGAPLCALSILQLPTGPADGTRRLLREITTGILAGCQEHGMKLVGGHTILGPDLLLGLSVFGTIPAAGRFIPKRGCEPSDALILTKPLGGLYTMFATQSDEKAWSHERREAVATMSEQHSLPWLGTMVHAATDVSGFGLAGHLQEMLGDCGLGATLRHIPSIVRRPHAVPMCAMERNYQAYGREVVFANHSPMDPALYAPETSGPLLLAVRAHQREELLARLHREGHARATMIGTVEAQPGLRVLS